MRKSAFVEYFYKKVAQLAQSGTVWHTFWEYNACAGDEKNRGGDGFTVLSKTERFF